MIFVWFGQYGASVYSFPDPVQGTAVTSVQDSHGFLPSWSFQSGGEEKVAAHA